MARHSLKHDMKGTHRRSATVMNADVSQSQPEDKMMRTLSDLLTDDGSQAISIFANSTCEPMLQRRERDSLDGAGRRLVLNRVNDSFMSMGRGDEAAEFLQSLDDMEGSDPFRENFAFSEDCAISAEARRLKAKLNLGQNFKPDLSGYAFPTIPHIQKPKPVFTERLQPTPAKIDLTLLLAKALKVGMDDEDYEECKEEEVPIKFDRPDRSQRTLSTAGDSGSRRGRSQSRHTCGDVSLKERTKARSGSRRSTRSARTADEQSRRSSRSSRKVDEVIRDNKSRRSCRTSLKEREGSRRRQSSREGRSDRERSASNTRSRRRSTRQIITGEGQQNKSRGSSEPRRKSSLPEQRENKSSREQRRSVCISMTPVIRAGALNARLSRSVSPRQNEAPGVDSPGRRSCSEKSLCPSLSKALKEGRRDSEEDHAPRCPTRQKSSMKPQGETAAGRPRRTSQRETRDQRRRQFESDFDAFVSSRSVREQRFRN